MTESNEQLRLEELYALIRYIYREKLAEKIITAFQEVLAAKDDPAERATIVLHWLDFYQARRYRKLMRRRRATDKERMTACSACGYPISQRHHLWDIATHGENAVTVQLCPNCHELHHLMYNAVARDSLYSQKLARHVLSSGRISSEAVVRIYGWLRAILNYEIEQGWLESYKLSDLWIEDKLGWNEYLSKHQTTTP
jgi:ribosomal protein L37E